MPSDRQGDQCVPGAPPTVVIAGATSGLGKALALGLATIGANVVVAGRDAERAAGLALTRTTLMGSGTDNEHAMPLDRFVSEAMSLLDSQQILVDRVKCQRFAEATGAYDEVFAMQAGR